MSNIISPCPHQHLVASTDIVIVKCIGISHYYFDSCWDNYVEYHFMCIIAIYISSLVKWLWRSYIQFLIKLFLLQRSVISSYSLEPSLLSYSNVYKYFHLSYRSLLFLNKHLPSNSSMLMNFNSASFPLMGITFALAFPMISHIC